MKSVQELLKTKKEIIYGTDRVLREARSKNLNSVYVSSNYPADMFVSFSSLLHHGVL